MPLRLLSCLLLSLVISHAASAEIYKTVDKNGRVVYTDQPGNESAEKVTLPPINTLPPEEASPYSPPPPEQDQQASYEIKIMSPRDNVAIPPGQRDLGIAVVINPALGPDHILLYFMNGELLQESTATNIVVEDVNRGANTIYVEAVDSNGTSLGKSPSVVVNVIRPIIKPKAPPPKKKAG